MTGLCTTSKKKKILLKILEKCSYTANTKLCVNVYQKIENYFFAAVDNISN